MCRPALAAMFIFTYTYAWEEFLWLVVMTFQRHFIRGISLSGMKA